MKKTLITLCFAFGLLPFFAIGQTNCFTSQSTIDGLVSSLNNAVTCALPYYDQGCIGIQSNHTQDAVGPSGTIPIDECDFICTADEPGPYSTTFQAELLKKALDIVDPFIPICPDTGEKMVVVNLEFYKEYCIFCGSNENFLPFLVTYACCDVADDCNADFDVEQSSRDCHIYLNNMGSPSSNNDCGDCSNPSGIASVTWQVYEYLATFPTPGVSIWLTSNDWNFDFDPLDAPSNPIGFQVCLTIEDCLGCTSRNCENLFLFSACNPSEFTSNEDQFSARKLIQSTKKSASVFPNPSSDEVNIQLKEEKSKKGKTTIEVYGLQGQLVKAVTAVNATNTTIDVSDLVAGIYIITVRTNGERIHTEQLIVQ